MTKIVVIRPDGDVPQPTAMELAPRRELPDVPVVGLISNGKPLARELLEVLAEELAERIGRPVELETLQKPSAGHAIELGEAKRMAARCHVLVSGLGD